LPAVNNHLFQLELTDHGPATDLGSLHLLFAQPCLNWPMNSPSQRGRSFSSNPCSSAREALTNRSGVLSRAIAMLMEI
jgi:hypothetical protein